MYKIKKEVLYMYITGIKALDLEIMERDERLGRICKKARSLWMKGINPQDYIDELFEEEEIDPDSLTSDELRKINSACS